MTKKENIHPDQKARLDQLKKYTVETVHGVKQQILFESYPEWMEIDANTNLQQLIKKVVRWHHDRNLIEGSSDKDQTLKLLQELGELSDSVCKGKDIKDDIGDMLVVMLNITTRNNVSLEDCLARAWQDIKDRKGRMVDGIFVKETDL
tara:strand:- start:357 stop:800 length:444 start_codon:yes stop_codon:yes gene_type:complete